jgi:hypothetical protein
MSNRWRTPRSQVDQISEFLALYNKNSGKHDEVKGIEGPDGALALLERAAARSSANRRVESQSATLRSRSALAITETELNVMAALAIMGLSRIPKNG